MTPLLDKRIRFARALPRLIDHVFAAGYTMTIGEVKRSPVQAEINALGAQGREEVAQLVERQFPMLARKLREITGNGIRTSLHVDGLAVDNEIRTPDGAWIQDAGPYRMAGEYWKTLGPDHRAGIDFGDAPHLSIELDGRK